MPSIITPNTVPTYYKNFNSVGGRRSSIIKWVCPGVDTDGNLIADPDSGYTWQDIRALLLRSADDNDSDLYWWSCEMSPLPGDKGGITFEKVELTFESIPSWQLLLKLPNQPFYRTIEWGMQSFTIPGGTNCAFKWADGRPISTANILPTVSILVAEISLKGVRSGVDLSTFSAYEDKVNNDTYMGAPAGRVLFRGANAAPKMLDNGDLTNDVTIRMSSRSVDWRKFYDATPNAGAGGAAYGWQFIKDGANNYIYGSADYSGLTFVAT